MKFLLEETLTIIDKHQITGFKGEIYYQFGAMHQSKADYTLSLLYYHQGLETVQGQRDLFVREKILGSIGVVQIHQGNYPVRQKI